jgi:hypothetical protein
LANTYLFVEAQIVADDGTALDAGADVGPVNLWMHSLFSDVSVSLNEKLVSPPTSLFPYRAYIETLLSYDRLVFFRLAGPLIARYPGGPTVSIAFWNKFCPVDFNRASAACLICLRWTCQLLDAFPL